MTGDWRQAGRWTGWFYAAGALLGGGLVRVRQLGHRAGGSRPGRPLRFRARRLA